MKYVCTGFEDLSDRQKGEPPEDAGRERSCIDCISDDEHATSLKGIRVRLRTVCPWDWLFWSVDAIIISDDAMEM